MASKGQQIHLDLAYATSNQMMSALSQIFCTQHVLYAQITMDTVTQIEMSVIK